MIAVWYFFVAAVCWLVAWYSGNPIEPGFWHAVYGFSILAAICCTIAGIVQAGMIINYGRGRW